MFECDRERCVTAENRLVIFHRFGLSGLWRCTMCLWIYGMVFGQHRLRSIRRSFCIIGYHQYHSCAKLSIFQMRTAFPPTPVPDMQVVLQTDKFLGFMSN